jgi:hypothetical protein
VAGAFALFSEVFIILIFSRTPDYPNEAGQHFEVTGFPDRPSKFRKVCPDNWTGRQKRVKITKKSAVRNWHDSLTIEQSGREINRIL